MIFTLGPGKRAKCKADQFMIDYMMEWWAVRETRSPKRRAGKVEVWG